MTDLIATILSLIEDFKFWKKKKARRKFEKENNLPKKLMIHPVWKLFGILLILFVITKLIVGLFYFSNYGINETNKKMTEIGQILEDEKNKIGNYPKELNSIIRNNPLRQNITTDYWGNEFFYSHIENGLEYSLISKGKDGILNTEDDIKINKNLP